MQCTNWTRPIAARVFLGDLMRFKAILGDLGKIRQKIMAIFSDLKQCLFLLIPSPDKLFSSIMFNTVTCVTSLPIDIVYTSMGIFREKNLRIYLR